MIALILFLAAAIGLPTWFVLSCIADRKKEKAEYAKKEVERDAWVAEQKTKGLYLIAAELTYGQDGLNDVLYSLPFQPTARIAPVFMEGWTILGTTSRAHAERAIEESFKKGYFTDGMGTNNVPVDKIRKVRICFSAGE